MMILDLFDSITKIYEDFKNWLINSDQWVILGLFFGLFFMFVIGWNAIHKHD